MSGFYMQASMQDPALDDSAPITEKWQLFSHLLMSHASLFPQPTICPLSQGFLFCTDKLNRNEVRPPSLSPGMSEGLP